jgi:hypothetical protein
MYRKRVSGYCERKKFERYSYATQGIQQSRIFLDDVHSSILVTAASWRLTDNFRVPRWLICVGKFLQP